MKETHIIIFNFPIPPKVHFWSQSTSEGSEVFFPFPWEGLVQDVNHSVKYLASKTVGKLQPSPVLYGLWAKTDFYIFKTDILWHD